MSIIGSFSIIYNILINRKRKLARPFHRIMLLMSFFDVLQSISNVISVAAFPTESNIYGAKGNTNSCMAQSFFMLLGLAVPLYNSSLKIYYVLTIRYNLSAQQFSTYEPAFHVIPVITPLSLAITFTFCGNISPRETVCYPAGAIPFTIILSFLSGCFLIHVLTMTCICWTVKSQAMRMRKFTNFGSRRNLPAQQSHIEDAGRKTILQALSYTLTFFLTYIFPIIGGAYTGGEAGASPPLAIIILSNIFFPLQGFWNFLFYAQSGVQHIIETNPDKSYLGAIREFIIDSGSTANTRRQSVARRNSTFLPSSEILRVIDSTNTLSKIDTPSSGDTSDVIEINDDDLNDYEVGILGPSISGLEVPCTNKGNHTLNEQNLSEDYQLRKGPENQ